MAADATVEDCSNNKNIGIQPIKTPDSGPLILYETGVQEYHIARVI